MPMSSCSSPTPSATPDEVSRPQSFLRCPLELWLTCFFLADPGDDALDLLAKAVQKNPDNEELAMDAFVQYLRVDDCKAAQQVRTPSPLREDRTRRYH